MSYRPHPTHCLSPADFRFLECTRLLLPRLMRTPVTTRLPANALHSFIAPLDSFHLLESFSRHRLSLRHTFVSFPSLSNCACSQSAPAFSTISSSKRAVFPAVRPQEQTVIDTASSSSGQISYCFYTNARGFQGVARRPRSI